MDNTEEKKNISKEKTKKKKEKPVRVKKVKSAKPAKAPKPKKEKAPKTTGKKGVKAKESKKKVPKQKSEIPFYHSIAMRLIASFLLPVVGVLVLGIVSYNKASSAIVNTYKESVQQTANTMQQYINLVITSEKDEFKTYLTESDLRKYFGQFLDAYDESSIRKDYQSRFRNKMALDSKMQSVFIIADEKKTIDGNGKVYGRNIYSDYAKCEQGKIATSSASNWYFFGVNEDADKVLDLDIQNYCFRIAKKMNNQPAMMIINISDKFIRSTMQSLNPGKGGYVALITDQDGKEFFSDGNVSTDKSLIYGTSFYKKAFDGKADSGNQMVTFQGKEYKIGRAHV